MRDIESKELLATPNNQKKRETKMAKGRNTTVISVRIPDTVLADLKKRAEKQGLGYTVLLDIGFN